MTSDCFQDPNTGLYLTTALGVGGSITRPFQGIIESQAAAVVPFFGGRSSSRVENYSFQGLVSFRAAYAEAGGSFDECHNRRTTFSYSVVEGLNIADVVTADRLVSRVVAYSPSLGEEGEYSFAISGSHFGNLRIAGLRIDVPLATEQFHRHDTYSKFETAYRSGKLNRLLPWGDQTDKQLDDLEQLEEQYHSLTGIGEWAKERKRRADRRADGIYWCSAAGHLDLGHHDTDTEVRSFGGIILIPKFGVVRLAEMLIGRSTRQLMMLRVDMCSPIDGTLTVGSADAGGSDYGVSHAPRSRTAVRDAPPRKISVPVDYLLHGPSPPLPEPPEPAPSAEAENTSSERRISFWIAERESNPDLPLELGARYNARFRVGLSVSASLFEGADIVPDSDVPQAGLRTHWKVVPTNLQFAATDLAVAIGASGEAEFDLLVPKIGDSPTVTVALTPLTVEAGLLVLIFVGEKLYRELSVSLRVTAGKAVPTSGESVSKTTRDLAFAPLGQADLRTTHEWTTPPGNLTLYVCAPGRATIFGFNVNRGPYAAGDPVYVGTEKSDLGNTVDALRKAAESLRTKATAYLNDIDPADMLNRLDNFKAQYDWAQLSYFEDSTHLAAWNVVAASKELQVLAFYGRKLYDTLFPADQNSRPLMDGLAPGQFVHVVWRKDSEANWIPHLPWELLYCGDANPGVPIDPTQFWGLRYRIQYTAYLPPKEPSASLGHPQESCCTSLLFFGTSSKELAEVEWQRQIWTALSGKIKSCLVPSGTANPKSEILKALTDPESVSSPAKIPAAVLYLFCHYGKDPSDTPILRFGDTSNPDDILTEPELGTSALVSRPLVFANACATAGTDVYSANAVTKAFFDRGCRAFIGTDCMVPAAMASRFAVIFFYFFLRLVDKQHLPMAAGEAIVQTRLFLWCHYRNIGGLLYSYLNQYDLYMASEAEIRALQKKG